MSIVFNKPHLTGKELDYVLETVKSLKISGNGMFTKKCHDFFSQKYGFNKCLLTTSCTDALEMCAMLLDVKPGDEVIVPSYTFVSSANAFVLRGAKIVFCDSLPDHPNIDPQQVQNLISEKTKAIIVVHYAGVACNMKVIMSIAKQYNVFVIEDAAQAIDSYYEEAPLGGIGHLAAFSFHETKNIISGEGGMLVINDKQFEARAEILWEKGTNRSAFFKGEVDKYNWVDIGSSFLPSDLIAAFLFAQLENLEQIQSKRLKIHKLYSTLLKPLINRNKILVPEIPSFATNNAHMFFFLCANILERDELINFLRDKGIFAVFHYQPLHLSPYYLNENNVQSLVSAEKFGDCIVRLPMYYELESNDVELICTEINKFYSIH